ncbi:DNA-binding protein [Proteiniclasticum sp.]|uniref:DNA-binding protein n=1 Tax=Proteiniclasticum sp. TaxID=2053595 RepID=UPI00289CEDC1|nr:DNA-binding protein [Proteiniclasticum sp.]
MAVGKDKTRILLTLPQDLKEELTDEAKGDNRSLNNYILNLLLSSEKRSENDRD